MCVGFFNMMDLTQIKSRATWLNMIMSRERSDELVILSTKYMVIKVGCLRKVMFKINLVTNVYVDHIHL